MRLRGAPQEEAYQTRLRNESGVRRPRGFRPALLLALLGLVALSTLLGSRLASAQIAGGLNVSLTPPAQTVQVGQAANFSYRASPPAVAPPFPRISDLTIDFGDGSMQSLPLTDA